MLKLKGLKYVLLVTSVLIGCVIWTQIGDENMNKESKDNLNSKAEKLISENKLASTNFLIETFDVTEEDNEKYEMEKIILEFNLSEEFF